MEEPGQATTGVGQLPAVDVPPRLEDAQHAVEAVGDGLAATLDALVQVVDLACRALGLGGGAQPLPQHRVLSDRVVDAAVVAVVERAGLAVRPAGHRRSRQEAGHLPLVLRPVGRERRGQVDAAEHARHVAEVPSGELHRDPARGQHLELHAALAPAGGQHGHPSDQPPAVHVQDVARPHPHQGQLDGVGVAGRRRRALPQPAVLVEVAEGAAGQLPQLGQLRLAPLEPGLHAHHVAVGLVLREGQVEQVVGLVLGVRAHQVGRHVVGRAERRAQLVRAARGQRATPGRRGRTGSTGRWRSPARRCPAGRPDRSAACSRPASGTRGGHR